MIDVIFISVNTKFYSCVVTRKDYLERIEGGGYDQDEYEQYPSRYKSTFNKKVWFMFLSSFVHFSCIFIFNSHVLINQYTDAIIFHDLLLDADRSVRFGHHQRDILGSGLFQTADGAGRKIVTFSVTSSVDTNIRRRPGTAAQITRHLRYICRPRRFHRVHERVHDHW